MPNTCAFSLPSRRLPKSERCGRRSVKPSAGPTLVRTLVPSRRGNAVLSAARPVSIRQNRRFWMSATNRTIILGRVPNGGTVRGYQELRCTVRNLDCEGHAGGLAVCLCILPALRERPHLQQTGSGSGGLTDHLVYSVSAEALCETAHKARKRSLTGRQPGASCHAAYRAPAPAG
jgi:hypothetical protein